MLIPSDGVRGAARGGAPTITLWRAQFRRRCMSSMIAAAIDGRITPIGE